MKITDASLMWFKRVIKFLDENNRTSSITDPATLSVTRLVMVRGLIHQEFPTRACQRGELN